MNEQLKHYSDEELLALISDAKEILHERDKLQKQEAMKQIRALAAEAGLSVQLKGKRKRKPKTPRQQKGDQTNEQQS